MEVYKYQMALRALQMHILKIQDQIDGLRDISTDKQLMDVFRNEMAFLESFEVGMLEFYTMIRKLHGDVGDCLEHMTEANQQRLERLTKLD